MGNTQSNSTNFDASGMPSAPTITGDCIVCTEEDVQLCALPCGHAAYCSECHTNELINLQEDSRRPACPICDVEIPLQILQPFIPTKLYEKMHNKIYVEWATPSHDRLYCADPDCAGFIPPIGALSSKGGRQCACGKFTCFTCKMLAHDGICTGDKELQDAIKTAEDNGGKPCPRCKVVLYRNGGCAHFFREHFGCRHQWCWLCGRDWDDCKGSCPDSHADVQRVQQELEQEEVRRAQAFFERTGRPTVRQVLAGTHVFLIINREYLVRTRDTVFLGIHDIIATLVLNIHDFEAPIDPIDLLAIRELARQIHHHLFRTVNLPFGDVYNTHQRLVETLFEGFRVLRPQEFIAYEREITRTLFVIYGDNDPDANELRDEINARLHGFGII